MNKKHLGVADEYCINITILQYKNNYFYSVEWPSYTDRFVLKTFSKTKTEDRCSIRGVNSIRNRTYRSEIGNRLNYNGDRVYMGILVCRELRGGETLSIMNTSNGNLEKSVYTNENRTDNLAGL